MTDTLEFRECPECAAKSGQPALCASCLHNRDVIERLKALVREREKAAVFQGIGWAHTDCCIALDDGEDPRTMDIAAQLDRACRDLELV